VEIMPHPLEQHRKVLRIRKPDEHWPAAAVWNFPAGSAGRIRLRILIRPGFQGALVALTDHFSTPFDLEDQYHSIHNLWIDAGGRCGSGSLLTPDQWHTLELIWNAKQQSCQVVVDDKPSGSLPVVRSSPNICYLRLRSKAEKIDDAGFLVESVEVDVQTDTSPESP
jgi:hypothetical protein